MRKFIFHEMRVQGIWLSGSKSHCSISSTEVVLLNDGKKRRHSKIGAIFKSIGKLLLKLLIAIASGLIVELLVSFIMKNLVW